MNDCVFCAIVAGDAPAHVIRDDEHTVAFLDINPVTRGHALVIPREHTRDLWDVERGTAERVMGAAWEVARRVRERLDPAGVNLFQATGPVAGQMVFHVHLHVVPRYEGDGLSLPLGARSADPDELARVAREIRGD